MTEKEKPKIRPKPIGIQIDTCDREMGLLIVAAIFLITFLIVLAK